MKPTRISPIIIEESLSIALDDPMTPRCIIDSEIETITPMSDNQSSPYDNIPPLTPLFSSNTTCSDCTDDDINDVPMLDLLLGLSNTTEDLLLGNYGYINKQKICDSLQGELYTANTIDNNESNSVMIKKIDKDLHQQRITIENGMKFITDENIVNEAAMLHHLHYLAANPNNINNNVIKYVDFFESETHFYLVMEHIDNTITLKDFIKKCHIYISKNKLTLKKYNKIIKHIFYELSQTLHWLHNSVHCAHLNLSSENILLSNAFIMNKNGKKILNKSLSVIISEFGCSERFKNNIFKCNKYALSIDNEQYLSPNINNQIYDGTLADTWAFGMIF
eukprot:435215_1